MATKFKTAKPLLAWNMVTVGELIDKVKDQKQEGILINYKDQVWILKLKKEST